MKKNILIIVSFVTLNSCEMSKNCSEFNSSYISEGFNIKIDSLWNDDPRRRWVFESKKDKKRFENGGVYALYHVANKGDRIIKKVGTNIIELYKNDKKDSLQTFKFECKDNVIYYNDKPMN